MEHETDLIILRNDINKLNFNHVFGKQYSQACKDPSDPEDIIRSGFHGCHKWAKHFIISDWSEQFFTWPWWLNIGSVKLYPNSWTGDFCVS